MKKAEGNERLLKRDVLQSDIRHDWCDIIRRDALNSQSGRYKFFLGSLQGCFTPGLGSRWAYRTATNAGFSIYYRVFFVFTECQWGTCWLNLIVMSTAFYSWVEGWNTVWLLDAELYVLAMLRLCHTSPVHKPSKQAPTSPYIQLQSSRNNYFLWNLRIIIHSGQKEHNTVWHQHYGCFLLKTSEIKVIAWIVDELNCFPNKNPCYRYNKTLKWSQEPPIWLDLDFIGQT